MIFPNAHNYLQGINSEEADELDITAYHLLNDPIKYERASQALRRRFVRGARVVKGIDRHGRETHIRREKLKGTYVYYVEGSDGSWSTPDERIWVVAMYALWQNINGTTPH